MSLFKLSLNNLRRNFKSYLAFFISCSFSFFVLYTFMAIINNKAVQSELGSMQKFLMLFAIASQMITIFSAFFIWYSNSYFVKARKKEFATYMLLGMSKRQVFKMHFMENLVNLSLALLLGVFVGVLFNKFLIVILYILIGSTSKVSFTISLKAVKFVIIFFVVMFFIISIHSKILIYKNTLKQLFSYSSKAEKIMSVNLLTYIFALLAIVILGSAYYLSSFKIAENFMVAPLVILLVVIGTILFFTSLLSLIIHYNKKNEGRLFKGTRLITNSQLYFRYKSHVGALTVIAITSTVALTAMISCFGLYDKVVANARMLRPNSIEFKDVKGDNTKLFQKALKEHGEISIKAESNIEYLVVSYESSEAAGQYHIISETCYRENLSKQGKTLEAKLNNEKQCILIQKNNFVADKTQIGKMANLKLHGIAYSLKIVDINSIDVVSLDHSAQTYVVADSLYKSIEGSFSENEKIVYKAYELKNDYVAKNFIDSLRVTLPKEASMATFLENYLEALKLMGMVAFIGLFIGIVFITATGSILYFKVSLEAMEDKSKFVVLNKIGVDESHIKSAISKELAIIFGMPFALAGLNSYAAAIAFGKMTSFNMNKSFVIILLIYGFFYSLYYLASRKNYIKTVI